MGKTALSTIASPPRTPNNRVRAGIDRWIGVWAPPRTVSPMKNGTVTNPATMTPTL